MAKKYALIGAAGHNEQDIKGWWVMRLTTIELIEAISTVADELGIELSGLAIDTSRSGMVINNIRLTSYWKISVDEVTMGHIDLKRLVRIRQIDALYGLQNLINEKLKNLGEVVDD